MERATAWRSGRIPTPSRGTSDTGEPEQRFCGTLVRMAVGSLIPVEEYLATVCEVECECADGELIERNRGESDHSGVQMALAALL
jgi:hypothetical protein